MRSILDFKDLYIHCEPVDFRKNINGLCAIVSEEMRLDLKASALFIFSNKKRSHMKILYFDRSGFAIWLKRLEAEKFPWPKNANEQTITITVKDMALLLEGINVFSRFEDVHFEKIM